MYSDKTLYWVEGLLKSEREQKTSGYASRCFELQQEIKSRINTGHRVFCQCNLCIEARQRIYRSEQQ